MEAEEQKKKKNREGLGRRYPVRNYHRALTTVCLPHFRLQATCRSTLSSWLMLDCQYREEHPTLPSFLAVERFGCVIKKESV